MPKHLTGRAAAIPVALILSRRRSCNAAKCLRFTRKCKSEDSRPRNVRPFKDFLGATLLSRGEASLLISALTAHGTRLLETLGRSQLFAGLVNESTRWKHGLPDFLPSTRHPHR